MLSIYCTFCQVWGSRDTKFYPLLFSAWIEQQRITRASIATEKWGGRASKSWKNTAYIIGPKYHSARGPSEKWKNISPLVRYSFNKNCNEILHQVNGVYFYILLHISNEQSIKKWGDIWYAVPSSLKSEGDMYPTQSTSIVKTVFYSCTTSIV